MVHKKSSLFLVSKIINYFYQHQNDNFITKQFEDYVILAYGKYNSIHPTSLCDSYLELFSTYSELSNCHLQCVRLFLLTLNDSTITA